MDMLIVAAATVIIVLIVAWMVLSKNKKPAEEQVPQTESSGQEEEREESDKPKLLFFYGSQTGTAEGFCEQLVEDGIGHGFDCEAVDLEDFEAEQFDEDAPNVAIFLMATYGEGDPTDNALDFSDWIKTEDAKVGENFQFSVFGLGNTQYEHFNSMGKLVNSRLEELGGRRVYQFGMGDDDKEMEEDFDAWVNAGFWNAMREACGMPLVEEAAALPITFTPPFKLRSLPEGTKLQPPNLEVNDDLLSLRSKHFFRSKPYDITVNRELRKDLSGGSTLHVELRGSQNQVVKYGTADNLSICPENLPSLVESIAKRLGFALDEQFVLETEPSKSDMKLLFPTPCTVRCALTRYIDLSAIPKKRLLKVLASYTGKGDERQQLMNLAGPDGIQEYSDLASGYFTVLTVLERFPSISVPLCDFVQLMPPLRPREYTISSSSIVHPECIHISVSIMNNGITSTMLADNDSRADKRPRSESSSIGGQQKKSRSFRSLIRGFVTESTFKLPESHKTPVIMVGPGTGIAPMRAFLQERDHQRKAGKKVGDTILFFGCRRRQEDFIYEDELTEYSNNGTLTRLHTAFSREQKKKVYVQHKIADQGEELWSLLHNSGAHIYVCGATRMGADVKDAFKAICRNYGGMDDDGAKKYIAKLESEKRYIQELWSV